MKNRWVIAALAVSLALNLAGLGAFGLTRLRQYRHQQAFYRHLRAGAKGRLAALFEKMEPKMDSLRFVYWDARRELGTLGLEKDPDPAKVESLLNVIAETHKEMNREIYEGTRTVGSFYPPERQEKLRRRMLDVWEGPPGHRPRGGGFHRGPGKWPHRGRRPPPPPHDGFPPEAPGDDGP